LRPSSCYLVLPIGIHSLFAPRSESANRTLANSLPGTFAPAPFRSLAHSLLALLFPGTFLPGAWVFCGQTLGRIKMKLGIQVGLGPGDIVLDRNPAPLPKGAQPSQFSAHISCGQMAAWIKMPLGMEVGLGPGDFVLDYRLAPRMHRNSPF